MPNARVVSDEGEKKREMTKFEIQPLKKEKEKEKKGKGQRETGGKLASRGEVTRRKSGNRRGGEKSRIICNTRRSRGEGEGFSSLFTYSVTQPGD